ncbi:NAD-dependent deacylase [Candidatus Aciduliprofundum boonei]|uniref:NAD-dependent protein deacylase n=1 Tax=Aciduliprofundum boonei (strain DSM 19572 / T469) TaxID=439481 RepID=D3TBS9_ACIB4|nr:NAD-dependent deacylase [Candidatus Aciduliprofundum boonei]ADD08014.1 Silent information regulator protein Sir2 [Aciduliprofundum boonei T469]HII55117.1 NAD-dependent deacylase [Candidatus Aciduliprofundum boonei]
MDFSKVIKVLLSAKRIVALTGAGISAESGIPTFRGTGGLWEGYPVEKVATIEGFERDPALVWKFYDERRRNIAKARPNRAHEVLALFENLYDFWVITQNIDGLHSRAGSKNVVELHGNIWRVKCTECGIRYYNYEVPLREIPPKCKRCGGLLRPDVVWFGEPVYDVDKAYELTESCDVMLVIGTSAQVYPAAYLPRLAWSKGAKIIEINPQETPISRYANFVIREKATKALDELYRGLLRAFQEE